MFYEYKAINGDEILEGSIESKNLDDAIKSLKSKGLKPIKVSENISYTNEIKLNKGFKNNELQILFKELYMLMNSGISLEKSFDILADQFSNKKYSSLSRITSDLENGLSLWEAMDKTGNFSKFVISLVYVGESTSHLRTVFKNLSDFYKKNKEIKYKIINALAYPVILLVTTFLIVNFLITNVIPGFKDIFESAGTNLPLMTRIILNISDFFSTNKLFLLGILLIIVLYIFYLHKNKPKIFHRLWLKNNFYRTIKCLYFSFNMDIFLSSGMTIDKSLRIICNMEENLVFKDKLNSVILNIKSGKSLWESLLEINIFPKIFISLIRVGEESSSLKDSFRTCFEFYNDTLDKETKRFLNILGPVLIIVMSLIVGFIVLAIALPIFDMVNQF